MPKLVVLGTAHAVPDEDHENTHFAILGERHRILVDCVGNPIVHLRKAGIEANRLTDLFLTHFHPDHVSGVPSLLLNMWLLGRSDPLDIYGLAYTLDRVEKLMDLFGWDQWPGFYRVNFHRLPESPLALALDNGEFRVYSSPVEHLIPTIGLRFESRQTGKTLAYSCDTQPCGAVVQLADKTDVLLHEATGDRNGHSSPAQAGRIAAQAGVGALYLVHYDPRDTDIITQAQKEFLGPVVRAEDFMTIEF
jgi:ribonuclease Z